MSLKTQTLSIPHLFGGVKASYALSSSPPDFSKPFLILINSFGTDLNLFASQFAHTRLTSVANLLAINPLGHGETRAEREMWTYWDTAEMNLEVMKALGVKRAFVLGTSQGGWIAVRMGLLEPAKVRSGVLCALNSIKSRWRVRCFLGISSLGVFERSHTPSGESQPKILRFFIQCSTYLSLATQTADKMPRFSASSLSAHPWTSSRHAPKL